MDNKKGVASVLVVLGIFVFAVIGGFVVKNTFTGHIVFEGGDGSLANPYQIGNCTQLQGMNESLGANYTLIDDIDCSDTVNWNNGAGFGPVGKNGNEFKGRLDGNGYVISDLFINRTGEDYVGLFGYTDEADINNVGLENVDITGNQIVGGLIGYIHYSGEIDNCFSTGIVRGNNQVGGLIGSIEWSSIVNNSYSTADVTATAVGAWQGKAGGLIGEGLASGSPATPRIYNSYAIGNVSGNDGVGGLVGSGTCLSIYDSYATGNVSGNDGVGGLIGFNSAVDYCPSEYVKIYNTYATGDINGNQRVGGLAGSFPGNYWRVSLNNSYATGNVYGNSEVGGLIGYNEGDIGNSYYNNHSGNPDVCGCSSGCTAIDNNEAYFFDITNTPMTSWDFINIWDDVYDNVDYPPLIWHGLEGIPFFGDVSFIKTANTTNASEIDKVRFTINITNTGDVNITNVTILDWFNMSDWYWDSSEPNTTSYWNNSDISFNQWNLTLNLEPNNSYLLNVTLNVYAWAGMNITNNANITVKYADDNEEERFSDAIVSIYEPPIYDCYEYLGNGICQVAADCSCLTEAFTNDSCIEVRLNESINNYNGTCVSIIDDDKVFDCQNHYIEGDLTTLGKGIYLSNVDNVTVKNCLVTIFDNNIFLGYSSNCTIKNNKLNWTSYQGPLSDYEMYVYESYENIFENNSLQRMFLDSSYNNILLNNRVEWAMGGELYSGFGSTSNYLIYNNSNGEMFWTNSSFLDDINIDGNLTFPGTIVIDNNYAYLDEWEFGENVYSSVNITFNNMPSNFSNPVILRNGYPCQDCINYTSLNVPTVKFEVQSWSNYSIGEEFSNPPNITSVVLTTTNPNTNDTNQNLTGFVTAYDPDGDNITYWYNWYMMDMPGPTTLIPDGLVSYYPFNNDSYDYYGSNDGVAQNGAFLNYSGKVGGSYQFDGSDDFVNVSDDNSLDLTNQLSIFAWIKTSTGGASVQQSIVGKDSGSSGYVFKVCDISTPGDLCFFSSGTGWVSSDTIVNDGVWHLVGVTGQGTSGTFYLDGEPDGTFTFGAATTNNVNLLIGKNYDNKDFNGQIDEVMIFNRSLTDQEVMSLYYGGLYGGDKINEEMTLIGDTWKLGVRAGDAGNTFSEEVNSSEVRISFIGQGTQSNPYNISDCEELQSMNTDLTAYYQLVNDIDCSETSEDYWSDGSGFMPIGAFEGSLNGNGYVISDLFINRTGEDYVGLFGSCKGGFVGNLGLENVNITGNDNIGGIIGRQEDDSGITILDSLYVSGSINGNDAVGGVVGLASPLSSTGLIINNSYSIGNINGNSNVGGIIGYVTPFFSTPLIINNSYSIGNINGNSNVGGLIGRATGQYDGILILDNSYATGNVSGNSNIGGIIGYVNPTPSILHAYITNNYYNNHSGNPSVCIGSGPGNCTAIDNNEAYFQGDVYPNYAPMSSWDFYNTWEEVDGDYPKLTWQGLGTTLHIPYVSSVTLSSTNPNLNNTIQNLTATSIVASDEVGDNITYWYNWYKISNIPRNFPYSDFQQVNVNLNSSDHIYDTRKNLITGDMCFLYKNSTDDFKIACYKEEDYSLNFEVYIGQIDPPTGDKYAKLGPYANGYMFAGIPEPTTNIIRYAIIDSSGNIIQSLADFEDYRPSPWNNIDAEPIDDNLVVYYSNYSTGCSAFKIINTTGGIVTNHSVVSSTSCDHRFGEVIPFEDGSDKLLFMYQDGSVARCVISYKNGTVSVSPWLCSQSQSYQRPSDIEAVSGTSNAFILWAKEGGPLYFRIYNSTGDLIKDTTTAISTASGDKPRIGEYESGKFLIVDGSDYTVYNSSGDLIVSQTEYNSTSHIVTAVEKRIFGEGADIGFRYDPSNIGYLMPYNATGMVQGFVLNATTLIEDGLVSYYPFNNDSYDYWGSNDGILVGAITQANGKIGKGYDFSGGDSYRININNSNFALPSETTISIWMYATSYSSGSTDSVLISNLEKFVNHDAIGIEHLDSGEGGNIFAKIINSGGTIFNVTSDNNIPLNSWHHVVLTISSGKEMLLYIDGEIQNSNNIWTGSYSGQTTTYIGNFVNDDDNFNGMLDEVMIFNRSLSASEVQQLYYGGLNGGHTLSSDLTTAGENWILGVRGGDYGNTFGGEQNSNPVTILSAAPNIDSITPINESETSGGSVAQGDNLTINVTVSDIDEDVDSVWVEIWEGVAGISDIIFEGFLDLIQGVWSIIIGTNYYTPSGELNYTIYANDSENIITEQNASVQIIKITPNSTEFNTTYGSTNFSAVPDITNVTNLTLASSSGKIQFPEDYGVDAKSQDYNSFVEIGDSFVSINTTELDGSFNSTANITINNVICPATIFYGENTYTAASQIIGEGMRCNDTTNPSCTDITCIGNNITFTVNHFTGFAALDACPVNMQGIGTQGDPCQITNCTDLQSINDNLNYSYVLANNINCSDTINWNSGSGFDPIGNENPDYFKGSFNGHNYIISNLYINKTGEDYVGLFGYITNTSIVNVGLENINITGNQYVGGLIGYTSDDIGAGNINNTHVTGYLVGGSNIGGVIGQLGGTGYHIFDSYSTTSVSGVSSVGGLVGYMFYGNNIVENCYATGNISGSRAGGLVGECSAGLRINNCSASGKITGIGGNVAGGLVAFIDGCLINNSYATGEVIGAGTNIGGLVGSGCCGGGIQNSYATGDVNGSSFIGGLIGGTSGGGPNIFNSYSTGDVVGTGNNVGGLLGNSDDGADIDDSYAIGNVFGGDNVGGLAGHMSYADTDNSYAEGNINGTGNWIGGLVGRAYDSDIDNSYAAGYVISSADYVGGLIGSGEYMNINNSYATGYVRGPNRVGGLVGWQGYSEIDNCYAEGNINGTGNWIGGLVGWNQVASINNSYATGDVDGSSSVGGLVGSRSYGGLMNSYAIGNVNGSDNIGGLVGSADNGNSFKNSFATGRVTGTGDIGGLIGYAGFEFITNCYYYNQTGYELDCVGDYDSSNIDDCTAETEESYFFNIDNLPIVNWSFPPWDDICDDNGYPSLQIKGLTSYTQCRGYVAPEGGASGGGGGARTPKKYSGKGDFLLEERDYVEFSYDGEHHILTLTDLDVYNKRAKISITSDPIVFFLYLGKSKEVDIYFDGEEDHIVEFKEIIGRKAKILISLKPPKSIKKEEIIEEREEEKPMITPEVKEVIEKVSYTLLILIGVGIFMGLIIILSSIKPIKRRLRKRKFKRILNKK